MAGEQGVPEPDQTAIRVALWRALHLEADGAPPVLADPVGLRLVPVDFEAGASWWDLLAATV